MYEVDLTAIDNSIDDALAVIHSYLESDNTVDGDYARELQTILTAMKLVIGDRCRPSDGDSFMTRLAEGT